MKALCARLDPRKCTLFAGHLFVSGAKLGGGERTLTIGPDLWRHRASAAAGAVRRARSRPSAATRARRGDPARYAGSLLQLDFGETEQTEERRHRRGRARQAGRGARDPDQRRPAAARRQRTMEELAKYAETADSAFLRVTLKCDEPRPASPTRYANGCRTRSTSTWPTLGPRSRHRLPPRAVAAGQFAGYYAGRHGSPASDAMLDMFDELVEAAQVS